MAWRRVAVEKLLGVCLLVSLAIYVWGETQNTQLTSAGGDLVDAPSHVAFASEPDGRPEVCVEGGNPRTASLFQRGVLEHHGSPLRYRYHNASYKCPEGAPWRVKLFKDEAPVLKSFVDKYGAAANYWQEPGAGYSINVLAGDELCAHSSAGYAKEDNVVARQYDSTADPAELAYLPLGARYEFDAVLAPPSPQRRRKYSMSFIGSYDTDVSREALKSYVDATAKPEGMKDPFFAFGKWTSSPTSDTDGHLGPSEYRRVVLDSDFTLAPSGHNLESFRFWEAIEAGSIPVMAPPGRRAALEAEGAPVGDDCAGSFQQVLCTEPPIVMLESWDDVYKTLSAFSEEDLAERRTRLATWNTQWWRRVAACLAGKITNRGADVAECHPCADG